MPWDSGGALVDGETFALRPPPGVSGRETIEAARTAGLLVVDLGDEWAPFIFSESDAGGEVKPNAYRSTFITLANNRATPDELFMESADGQRAVLVAAGVPPRRKKDPPTPENLARLRRALHTVYADDSSIDEIRDADLLGEYPWVRYYPPSGDLFLDVMTRLGDDVSFDTVEAEIKEVEGIRVRVATPLALYRMKKDTVRPLDHRDAAALAERFNLKEHA